LAGTAARAVVPADSVDFQPRGLVLYLLQENHGISSGYFMSKPLDELEAEALNLPTRERARLARRLLTSLQEDESADAAEIERAWEEEIRRRLEAYHAGGVQTMPASEVFARARDRLLQGRPPSVRGPQPLKF
jgi:putative addiction module component (TIGR02574 family)